MIVDLKRTVELATLITEVSRPYSRNELVKALDLILKGISQADTSKGRLKTAYEELGETWE